MKRNKRLKKIALLINIAVFTAYLINKIIFLTSSLREALFTPNGHRFNWRLGEIFYTKQGTGSPLLLLHDLNCTSSDFEWSLVVNDLAKKYTVYTIDLIGCGRSAKPKFIYTNFLYVQLVSDFIKNVIKQRTDVVGTGNISSVLIMSSNNNNQLINKIVLINPENPEDLKKFPKCKHTLLKNITQLPIIGTSIYNMITNKNNIKHIMKTSYFYNPLNVRKKYINAYYEAAHLSGSSSKFLYSSIINHYTKINITHALNKIDNNILIIRGEYDLKSKTAVEEYLSYNNSIEVAVIAESGYLPQLERPGEVVNNISIFLN